MVICALALISPAWRASSGSRSTIIKNPPPSGSRAMASAVSSGILERRTLSVSTQMA